MSDKNTRAGVPAASAESVTAAAVSAGLVAPAAADQTVGNVPTLATVSAPATVPAPATAPGDPATASALGDPATAAAQAADTSPVPVPVAAAVALPGQERFVAPAEEIPLAPVDSLDESEPATSMWQSAWRSLRRNPLFIVAALLIILIFIVAAFPQLFTNRDPAYCDLADSLGPSRPGHIMGFDLQGCDIYARVIYGTRTSVSVGVLTTLIVILVGGLIGAVSGFFGGWLDEILSRVTDIFFAVPLLLGAIVLLQMFKSSTSIWKVILTIALFGWVQMARITRGAVLESRNLEFNTASTALGSTPSRNLFKHVLPNSLAPMIVVATTSLGAYIVTEATLSFLGVGLPSSVISWGGDISSAQSLLRSSPAVLFYPSAALAVTVLAFIMMGDAIKDALDPKSKTR